MERNSFDVTVVPASRLNVEVVGKENWKAAGRHPDQRFQPGWELRCKHEGQRDGKFPDYFRHIPSFHLRST